LAELRLSGSPARYQRTSDVKRDAILSVVLGVSAQLLVPVDNSCG
jgi:hypothetical protein